MITVRYNDDLDFHRVYSWCEENCHGDWYSGMDWNNWVPGEHNRIVQFVDRDDAVLFALRWSNARD